MRSRRAALALLALAAATCHGRPAQPNVLLVTIDTLRADRLGCYGDAAAETPALDALAREGVLFRHAYAPAPLTLPAHATILTGLEPAAHGLVDNGMTATDLGVPSLAERLADAGYDTAAFVSAFVLNRLFGLERGFARYDDGPAGEQALTDLFHGMGDAQERLDAAIRWLARARGRPFFLWVHLFDVHAPHVAPPPFAKRYASRPYDGEVAYVDLHLGRLLHVLDERGLARDTLVVVTADHGESLGEHGEETHGVFLYDATLRVPLLVRLPRRLPAGLVVDAPVTLADVTPTVLALLDLPPNRVAHGQALFRADGTPTPPAADRVLWAQSDYPARQYGWSRLRAVRAGAWKYVEAPRPELYDLEHDPDERDNRLAEEAVIGARLRARLGERERELTAGGPDPSAAGPDAATAARLAALGYRAGAADSRPGGADPKDRIADVAAGDRAYEALAAGDPEAAQTLFRAALARLPDSPTLREGLARALEVAGRSDEAAAQYRRVLEVNPTSVTALARLLALARARGDADAALEAARRLHAQVPSAP